MTPDIEGASRTTCTACGYRVSVLTVAPAAAAPTVVCLHGLHSSALAWQDNLAAWGRHYRVAAPDLPGRGQSEKPDAPYDGPFYDRVLGELLPQLGPPPYILAGNSMGGWLALRYAGHHAGQVAALVLFAPFDGRPASADVAEAALARQRMAFKLPRTERRALIEVQHTVAHERACGRLAQARAAQLAAPDADAYERAVYRSLESLLLHGALPVPAAQIRAPALIVWGALDQVIPLAHGKALAAAWPAADFRVLPGTGHVPQLEVPEIVNPLVLTWLAHLK